MLEIQSQKRPHKPPEKFAIVFHYARANIYSYHALIGALEISPILQSLPIFLAKPKSFFKKINNLYQEGYTHLIIGFSCSTFQIENIKQRLTKLQSHSKRKQMTIVMGGPHPSAKPIELLNAGADVIVIGEGEKTFPELLSAIIFNISFKELKGIAYFDPVTNDYEVTPRNDFIDLNNYPPFAPKHELYSAIEIARGCPYGCTFCQTPELFGRIMRFRSPKEVIKWGKFLLSKRDSYDFRFVAPNAFGYYAKKASKPNIGKIEELLSGLYSLEARKRRRIYFGTFPSEVRPESVTDETLQLIKKYCANDNLTMGAQSGSPKILKLIRRGHTIDDVISAVELANSYDFLMNIDIIFGFPEETAKDQFQTLDFCKILINMGCKIHMHYLIPLPGTKYENAEPREIHPDILEVLRQWSNDGTIFGSWQYQYQKVK
ncbi:MAG: TIGR04013 family B12-binding domain/radical SAM domain-containing protein [Asgard group archaeon]|nr:TIGR04013 family B12-binding domain/radical SAM domain-containing protein [Asgard group archaeon]